MNLSRLSFSNGTIRNNYLKIVIVIFLVMFGHDCIAQQIKPADLFGKWKVKDLIFLQQTGETQSEYNERMEDYQRCLNAIVVIDKRGINTLHNNICYLDPCIHDFSNNPHYLRKKVVEDNDYTRESEGTEMIDSNIVGRHFVGLMDSMYNKPTLTLLDTGCEEGYGDYTMKICIIDKNRIGLFCGWGLIILERVK